MKLKWKRYDSQIIDRALEQSYCLYVFHHPKDKGRPWYIGKAKFFGTAQPTGYQASARYNGGYVNLVAGMLHAGFSLYIATLTEAHYADLEGYEQELIAAWNPICEQKRKDAIRKPVNTAKPWDT